MCRADGLSKYVYGPWGQSQANFNDTAMAASSSDESYVCVLITKVPPEAVDRVQRNIDDGLYIGVPIVLDHCRSDKVGVVHHVLLAPSTREDGKLMHSLIGFYSIEDANGEGKLTINDLRLNARHFIASLDTDAKLSVSITGKSTQPASASAKQSDE